MVRKNLERFRGVAPAACSVNYRNAYIHKIPYRSTSHRDWWRWPGDKMSGKARFTPVDRRNVRKCAILHDFCPKKARSRRFVLRLCGGAERMSADARNLRRKTRKRAKKRRIARFSPGKGAFAPSTMRLCGRAERMPTDAYYLRRKTRKRAKKRGNARFCPKMPRSRRLPCGCAAGRRLRPPMRIICVEKRGKERKNAIMQRFVEFCAEI